MNIELIEVWSRLGQSGIFLAIVFFAGMIFLTIIKAHFSEEETNEREVLGRAVTVTLACFLVCFVIAAIGFIGWIWTR